jgi:hypothetical protein
MVLASISVLALLITELTYTAQINQKLAYDGLDQIKALYLAKSGLKLSLLRLKAYQIVKEQIASMSGSSKTNAVPQSLIDKIWSFPFFFPIPESIPGLTIGDKDQIKKFQDSSNLSGNFSAVIESVSSRYNLNSILASYGPIAQPSSGPSGSSPSSTPSTGPSTGPSAGPSAGPYNADNARQSLSDYLTAILQKKFDDDPDLASDYRDLRMDDFMDALTSWADPTYERKNTGLKDPYPPKRGPFYSVSELHMLPMMDDQLYGFFEPTLTAQRTPGININSLQAAGLRALVPNLTDDEVKDFFKYRDDPEQDNTFQSADDFYTYLKNSTGAYKSNDTAIGTLKSTLAKRNIQLIVEEKEFKITVVATVNQSVRKIEAWVTLMGKSGNSSTPQATPSPAPAAVGGNIDQQPVPDPGVRITFMRVS